MHRPPPHVRCALTLLVVLTAAAAPGAPPPAAAPAADRCPAASEREIGALARRALRAAALDRAPVARAPAGLPRLRAELRGDRRSVIALLLLSFDLPRALLDRRALGADRGAQHERAALIERVAAVASERARLRCAAAGRSRSRLEEAGDELRLRAAEAELRALTGEVAP